MTVFARMCKHRRCKRPTRSAHGYCAEHEKVAQEAEAERQRRIDADRPNAAARGYCRVRWRRFRRAHLSANPVCVECERQGRTTLAEHVDHIRPVTGPDDPAFFDDANVQSLCASCHSRKTLRESRRR